MSEPLVTLSELVPFPLRKQPAGLPDVAVTGVTRDPRRVGPGHVFVDLAGGPAAVMADAVGRGAVAVVSEKPPSRDVGVPVLLVQDARRALAHMADRLYGQPSKELGTCGVTGTFGKSTVAYLCGAALRAAGLPAGVVGAPGRRNLPREHLQSHLRDLRNRGTRACVIEVTSRDLALGRMEAVHFGCGIFTNLHPRHLRWHGGLEEYLDAKCELFRGLGAESVALLNRDDPAHEILAGETRARVLTFGVENGGDLRARILAMTPREARLEVVTPVGTSHLRTPLVGHHNVSNILAALGGALALGADPEAALLGLQDAPRVPGRMERLRVPAPFSVFVDAAPSAVALEKVLGGLRALAAGRLWVLFGSSQGGSPVARRALARAAERYADVSVVTSDSPGTEHPMAIIRDLMRGFRRPRNVLLEPDRRTAIALVLERAGPGDVVLLAGRGDARVQIVGETVLRLDDRDEVTRWFRTRGRSGAARGRGA